MTRSYHSILLLILIIICSISGKNLIKYRGKPYFTDKILNSHITKLLGSEFENEESFSKTAVDDLLDFYVDKGFPLTVISIDSLISSSGGIQLFLKIDSGDFVRYSGLIFKGNEVTKPEYLIKKSQLDTKGVFNETELIIGSEMLYKSGLFKSKPEFGITGEKGSFKIMYDLIEKKYFSLMLLGGFSSKDEKEEFTGLAELKADNIFGTMRKAEFLWERYDQGEELRIKYIEPFLLDIPVASQLHFEQLFTEDVSLSRYYGFIETLDLSSIYSVRAGYSREDIYPDSLYKGSLNDISTNKYTGGMEYSTIFDPTPIPKETGVTVNIEFSSLSMSIKDSIDASGIETKFYFEYMEEPFTEFYSKLCLNFDQIYFDGSIPEFNRLEFGGIGTFRGYRKNIFRSDILFTESVDLYYAPYLSGIAFNIFYDSVQYNSSTENISKLSNLSFLWSVGGGIVFDGRLGEIEFLVGVPGDEGFSEAIAHVRYSIRF